MASNDYHFVTHWRLESTPEEVSNVLGDALDLTRWWPSVYLEVKELKPGDAQGVGKEIELYTKGWLPYTLRWKFRVTEVNVPKGFAIEAWGDFAGRGIWTFEPDGQWVNVTYDWKIQADKPLLKNFSFVMKPLFSANHHWAMAKGEESLKLELARRQANSVEERRRIPAPPSPTPSSSLPFLAIIATGTLAVFGLIKLMRSLRQPNESAVTAS